MSTRSRFTNTRKLVLIARVTAGQSIRVTSQANGIDESTLRAWIRNVDRIRASPPLNISIHRGRARVHQELERQIVQEVLTLRDRGLTVVNADVVDIAVSIDPNMINRSHGALRMWASRCMAANGIVNRCPTHVSQHVPGNLRPLIEQFHTKISDLNALHHYRADMVVNMDQTALYHGMSRRRTLNQRGAHTVRVLENPAASVRSTAVLAVTLSGEKLKPMVVFKGRPSGRIARGIATRRQPLPTTLEYAVQDNSWADGRVMMEWVDKCLTPHLRDRNNRALIILDTYSAHLTERFRSALSALNCDIVYIPGGLTPMLQPLDISVNKPIKDYIRDSYSRWARNTFNSETGLSRPTRSEISNFLEIAWDRLASTTIISGFNMAGINL